MIVLPFSRLSATRCTFAAIALTDALTCMRTELHHVRVDALRMPIEALIRLSIPHNRSAAKATFTARGFRKRYADLSMAPHLNFSGDPPKLEHLFNGARNDEYDSVFPVLFLLELKISEPVCRICKSTNSTVGPPNP